MFKTTDFLRLLITNMNRLFIEYLHRQCISPSSIFRNSMTLHYIHHYVSLCCTLVFITLIFWYAQLFVMCFWNSFIPVSLLYQLLLLPILYLSLEYVYDDIHSIHNSLWLFNLIIWEYLNYWMFSWSDVTQPIFLNDNGPLPYDMCPKYFNTF